MADSVDWSYDPDWRQAKESSPKPSADRGDGVDWSYDENWTKPEDKGFTGHARDLGLSALKSAIAVPESIVGLADIPTGGRVGKFLENEGGSFGFRPKEAKEFLSDLHTDQYKTQQREFQEADGILDKTAVALQNPSLIANTVVESAAPMLTGGVAARGIRALAPGVSTAAAGAMGEGAMMAGSQAEGIRQQTDDGLLTAGQSGASVATGALGTLFGYAGGRLAQRLGVGDVDTLLARGAASADDVAGEIARLPAKSIPRQVIEGAITEGFLEELPQSVSEQIIQNLALDRPWSDGVEDAAVMGTLAGMAMGGGASLYRGAVDRGATQDGADGQSAAGARGGDGSPAASPFSASGPMNPNAEQKLETQRATQKDFEEALKEQVEPQIILDENGSPKSTTSKYEIDLFRSEMDARMAKRQRHIEAGERLRAARKPSEKMGIDPSAGPLSAAAAQAVDAGLSPAALPMQQAVAQAEGTDAAGAFAGDGNLDVDAAMTARPASGAPGVDQAASDSSASEPVEQQSRLGGWNQRLVGEQERVQAAIEPEALPTDGTGNTQLEAAAAPAAEQTPADRWAAMTAEDRAAVAGGADLAPAIRRNLPAAQWERLNPKVQAKLEQAMQAQASLPPANGAPSAARAGDQIERDQAQSLAQPAGGPVLGTAEAAPAFDVAGRSDAQLQHLATSGRPGWREAAQAFIDDNGLNDTHTLQPQGKAFKVVARPQGQSEQAGTLAADTAVAPAGEQRGAPGVAQAQVTREAVDTVKQQTAEAIGQRLQGMKAEEVNTFAARFLPTMGLKPTASKARNIALLTDGARVNLYGVAGELGVELSDASRSALEADMAGTVAEPKVEGGQQATNADTQAQANAVTGSAAAEPVGGQGGGRAAVVAPEDASATQSESADIKAARRAAASLALDDFAAESARREREWIARERVRMQDIAAGDQTVQAALPERQRMAPAEAQARLQELDAAEASVDERFSPDALRQTYELLRGDQMPVKNESRADAGDQALEGRADQVTAADEFIPAPDGSIDFGEITPEMAQAMRRQAGKIRLQRGDDSFGERHIEIRHGDDIRRLGFNDVASFVADIARNINQVWQPGKTAQLVAIHELENDRVMFVELRGAQDEGGDYYTVRSAFPARKGFIKNKGWNLLWEDGRAQPSTNASSSAPFAEPAQDIAGGPATIPSGQSSDASLAPTEQKAKNEGRAVAVGGTGNATVDQSSAQKAESTQPAAKIEDFGEKIGGAVEVSGQNAAASVSDAEVRALVAQYAGVQGAPTDAQLREAVRQFRETEAAYGGREAFERAKAAGKTKLNYHQWVQVRTPNFKRWFGDWEIGGAKTQRDATTFAEAREQAKAFQGKPLTNGATGIVATVSRNSLDKMLSSKAVGKSESPATHSLAVANLDQLFERAMLGWSKPDSEGDPNIKAIHRFFAPVMVGGRAMLAKMTVKETAQESKANPLYSVEAISFEKMEGPAAQWVGEIAGADGIDPRTIRSAGLVESMAQRVQEFNPDTVSKVTDPDTGEPLVVYHGTVADFDAFDNSKTGANDRGLWGRGHYFSASVDSANSYAQRQGDGARVISAYVSLQNPLVIKTGSDLVTRLPDGKNTRELIGPNLDGAKIKQIALDGGHDGVIQIRPNGLIGDLVAFRPEQIKSAIGNIGTFDGSNPDIRFSFAGRTAQTADQYALAAAQRRIAMGENAETVRQDTGWHRGDDGKWRFEISDDQARVAVGGANAAEIYDAALLDGEVVRVADVLDHPQLFAAYPHLADVRVELLPAVIRAQARYQHSEHTGAGLLQINPRVKREAMVKTLLHELQHGIQFREGFAQGGSPEAFASDSQEQGADAYRRLAGEVEARNVETRRQMTPEQRRAIAPAYTSDTMPGDVLVTFNGKRIVTPPHNATSRMPMTESGLMRAMRRQFPGLAGNVEKMLGRGLQGKKGGLVMIDSADPLQIARVFAEKTGRSMDESIKLFSEDGVINGIYDPRTGLTFLVGPNLDPVTAPAVLLHESVHGQQRKKIDAQAMDMLMNRAQEKDENTRAFLDRVAQRMIEAGVATDSKEAAPYIVEQAVIEGRSAGYKMADSKFFAWADRTFGKKIGDFLRSVAASLRTWMIRHGGIKALTVDDLVGYAMVGVERAADGAVTTKGGSAASVRPDSLTGAIRAVIDAARNPGHAPQKAKLGSVADWLAEEARARAGLDIAGFTHVLDGSAVRHMLNRHTNPTIEKNRGQIPLTDADIAAAAEVIATPDQVVLGTKTQGHKDQIAYLKRQDDGSILYLEEVRTGRRELAAVSMRKYPAAKDFSDIVATLPSNARSDGGDGLIVVAPPGGGNIGGSLQSMTAQNAKRPGESGVGNVTTRPTSSAPTTTQRGDGAGPGSSLVAQSPEGNDGIRFSRSASQRIIDAGDAAVAKLDGWLDRKTAIPEGWTDQQKAAAGKFATFSPKQPVKSLLRGINNRLKDRAAQLIFDQFRPLMKVSKEAFMTAHLSKATDGALEAIAMHGLPVLRDGALAVDRQAGGGFLNDLASLGSAQEVNQFLMWVAANRAERLAAEGRENLFTPDDIVAMKAFARDRLPDGRPRAQAYAQMQARLNAYNKAVLDIAEKAGLIDPEGRKTWESEFYIPFYRVSEDTGGMDFSTGGTGLARQKVIRQLKGGTENLGDPLANIMSNWHMMLTASMRNMAANKALEQGQQLGIADRVDVPALAVPAAKGGTWTMQDGKKVLWQVHDPMVAEALEALNFTGYNNPAMRAAGKFKRMLTIGVTISPTFRIRNLMRDALQAVATADVGYNPLKNAVEGWKLTGKDSDTMAQLMAGGGAVRFGSFNDGQQAEYAKRMIAMGIKNNQILNTPDKLKNFFRRFYDSYQETGDRAETINRAVIYQRVLAETGSHLEASFAARDMMNFTSMGSSAAIRALSQVLPFFNARLQGMDRLVRGAAADPRRFWSVAGVIGMASALLYLLQGDDDEYKALPDYIRDSYWPVKLGGVWAYIPKPFEVGALGTVVERFTELMMAGSDYQARDFRDTLVGVLTNTLALNPVPQIVKPVGEAWFNYDMFRGQPIDSMAMERLLPRERFNANTSAAAVGIGRALDVSPQKVEHLVRGYFGWLGTQALNVGDLMARPFMDMPASPRRDMTQINNWLVAGDLFKEVGTTPSKYSERFYRVQREINAIYATANQARRLGNMEQYRELMSRPEMAARPMVANANRQITDINQQMRAVMADRNMSVTDKSRRLSELRARRDDIARRVDERARQGA